MRKGIDHDVIQQIDFSAHHPTVLVYEHFNLLPEKRGECQELLRREGYVVMEEALDTFCLYPPANQRLADLWPRLNPAVLSVHDLPQARVSKQHRPASRVS